MPRSAKRPKQKKGHIKVSQKPRSRQAGKAQGLQASSLSYEQGVSQFANYARLGLLADSNQIGRVKGGAKGRTTGFKPRVKDPNATLTEGPSELHTLEIEMPPALKTVRKVPQGERDVLCKLLAKHGTNHAAMARDGRLNQMQHTAAHLRRRIETMQAEDAEDAAAVAASLAQGKAAPPRRLRKKITKDPNPAFKRLSKHFN
jgi:hypothetical protein